MFRLFDMDFSERLRLAIKEAGTNNNKVAIAADISRSRVTQLLQMDGVHEYESLAAVKIARFLKVSSDWLMYEHGPKLINPAPATSTNENRPPYDGKNAISIDERMKYINALQSAVHAMASELGISPMDLIDDSQAGRQRILDTVSNPRKRPVKNRADIDLSASSMTQVTEQKK